MAGKHCMRCGGEMSSYASSCPWCGRSVVLSTVTQLFGLAVVVVVGLVLTGTVSLDELKSTFHLRGTLVGDVRQGEGEGLETSSRTTAPGGGRVAVEASPRPNRGAAPRVPRTRKSGVTIVAGCAGSPRDRTIRREHPDWEEWVLRSAGCGDVAVGFDSGQVKAVLGEPDSVARGSLGRQVWIYGARRVELRGGRVVAVTP